MSDLHTYAHRLAVNCIEDWAGEGWYELNEQWGTDFSDEELHKIVYLAQHAVVTIPEGSRDASR